VILNHDGTVRIERGFVRAEDEKSDPETVCPQLYPWFNSLCG